jgi:hypothetical protein|tara:strand:+ start:722 stop:1039 length:318 start_codon:yes stop_codon:yes gene_type:complete
MDSKEKFNQVWDDVMSIATEEEMRLVCNINGTSIESLESIIYVRTSYSTYDQWVEMEGCEEYKTCDKCCYDILDSDGNVMEHYCSDNNVIAGVDFSDSINQLNQL